MGSRAGVSFGKFGVDALEPKKQAKHGNIWKRFPKLQLMVLQLDSCLFLVEVKGILYIYSNITCRRNSFMTNNPNHINKQECSNKKTTNTRETWRKLHEFIHIQLIKRKSKLQYNTSCDSNLSDFQDTLPRPQ